MADLLMLSSGSPPPFSSERLTSSFRGRHVCRIKRAPPRVSSLLTTLHSLASILRRCMLSVLWHYQSGALATKDLLCRMYIDTRVGRPLVVMRLRSKTDGITYVLSCGSRVGFIDVIYLFVTTTLRGKAPDPLQWDVSTDLGRPPRAHTRSSPS